MKEKTLRQTGSSLVETMVALLIMGVGMLGVIGMQVKALQLNNHAHLYSQASFLANDMMESIRVSQASAQNHATSFEQDAPTLPACATTNNGCADPTVIAQWNLSNWKMNIRSLLPDGQGAVDVNGNVYTITVRFKLGESDAEDEYASVSITTGV